MRLKAQAGLEYLLTYGWALVLVATVIGAVVFVTSSPAFGDDFRISDPTSFILKGSASEGNQVTIKLQNISGGEIEVKGVSSSGYIACTVNGQVSYVQGIKVGSGGEILLECTVLEEGRRQISVDYSTWSGAGKTLTVSERSSNAKPVGARGESLCDDGLDNEADGFTDCEDPECNGLQSADGLCEYALELTCGDEFDNDADGQYDCFDSDCSPAVAENCDLSECISDLESEGLVAGEDYALGKLIVIFWDREITEAEADALVQSWGYEIDDFYPSGSASITVPEGQEFEAFCKCETARQVSRVELVFLVGY